MIRDIGLAVEALQPGHTLQEMQGVSHDEFVLHVELMIEAGLLVGRVARMLGPTRVNVERLTWTGYDFVDASRSNSLWLRAKTTVIKPTASWTFDLLKEWLKTEISKGLPSIG